MVLGSSVASQHNFCFEVRSGLGLLKNLVFAVHLTSPSNYRLQSKKQGFRRKTLILPIGRGPWYQLPSTNLTWLILSLQIANALGLIFPFSSQIAREDMFPGNKLV